MKGIVEKAQVQYKINFEEAFDISIPLQSDLNQVNCFFSPYFSSEIVKMGSFIGSVSAGGPVNFRNIKLNPHGNGTHTEGYGHISKAMESVNQILISFHYFANLLSVYPTLRENGDRVIEKSTLEVFLQDSETESLIIRTLPNYDSKKTMKYSGTNPCYFSEEAMAFIISKNVKHLLVDLPSVDREEDGGKLLAHHKFWSGNRKNDCTITELVYIDDHIKDGLYLLNLQVAPMENDASPSRPVLYKLYL